MSAQGKTQPERDPFREWPAPARYVVYGLVVLVVLLLIAAAAAVAVVRRSDPQVSGTLGLAGVQQPVEVVRDRSGIPQIYARDVHDLFLAQGFVTAQDRFWQMDVARHLGEGRLAEMFGDRAIGSDLFYRGMGWEREAQQEYDLLSPQAQEALDSFTVGVNAYLDQRGGASLSLEVGFVDLLGNGYQVPDWTSLDSLVVLKGFGWASSGGYHSEVDHARLLVSLPKTLVDQLYPAYPARLHPPIVGSAGTGSAVSDPNGGGGDGWVVSGAHTTSGRPLLAGDLRLDPTLPSPLQQVGLHCADVSPACPYDVSGLALPGLPGVLEGHNRSVAWGLSPSGADTTDLYLEAVAGHTYLSGRRRLPLDEREEHVAVAGRSPVTLTVRSTSVGPLLSDVSGALATVGANAPVPPGSPTRGNGYAVALAWSGLTPSATFDGILGLDRAADWREFRDALAQVRTPSFDAVYADTAGHIGYQLSGAIPQRPRGVTGDVPVPGWVPRLAWSGPDVPADRMPSSYDPPSGVIVAADQAPGGAIGGGDYGYRSSRVSQLLEQRMNDQSPLRVPDLTAIQADTRNPIAPILTPYLLDLTLPRGYYSAGQRLLQHWDYNQTADSAAAAFFNVVWSNVLQLTFADDLPAGEAPDGSSRWMYLVAQLLKDPHSPWWDDRATKDVVEDRDMILTEAMRSARDELTRIRSVRPRGWTWGALHTMPLTNPTIHGGPVPSWLFRRTTGVGGGTGSVDGTDWNAAEGYGVTIAPVARFVVDLGQLGRSQWSVLGGASGHAFSSHYTDQLEGWAAGQELPWPATRAEVDAADTLTLRP